jgi:pilus assembly protein CpaC
MTIRPAARAFFALTLLTLCRAADPPVMRNIALIEGAGQLLQFDRDVDRIAIAEPKIADAIVVSTHDVMVNAKGPGQTTLVIWETGNPPVQYNVKVSKDTTETDQLRASVAGELKAALPDAAVSFDGNAESIVLTGRVPSEEQFKRAESIALLHAKKVVNMLQVGDPREILVEVKFADVDRTALAEFGFNLLSHNPTMIGELSTQQFPGPLFSQLQFNGGQASSNLNLANLLNLFIFRSDINLGATVQALQQRNLAQILAEPNLLVVEGKDASFLAGGEFPFPTITTTPTSGGIAPVISVQFKKFGVQLNVTPVVTASGAISLKIKPEVSALDYSNAVTVDGVLIPAISSRVAETEIVLKDGESFAIAGLIDNRVTQLISKLRGIGDIPIIGQLFRSRSTQKTTDELLVVVTPHFVKPIPAGTAVPLPVNPEPFLPPAPPKKDKGGKGQVEGQKPAFVGPRGYEIGKQQQ